MIDIFSGSKTKPAAPTTSTPTVSSKFAPRSGGFNIFAKPGTVQKKPAAPTTTPPKSDLIPAWAKPFKLPNGNMAYETPSKSTIEITPDGKKIAHLAGQFGGGAYNIDPQNTSKVVNTGHTDYAGLPGKTGFERDDIVPVSLGGVNQTKDNLRYEPLLPKDQQDPGKLTASDAILQEVNSLYKAGKISLGEARLRILTAKQNQTNPLPSTSVKSNFLPALAGTPKDIFTAIGQDKLDTQKALTAPSKPAGMEFKVGEGLNEEQTHKAKTTIVNSIASEENRQALRSDLGADSMNIKKAALDIFRAPIKGVVQVAAPTDKIEPIEGGKLIRFVFGDEPLTGYSRQAADDETTFKEKGYGKLSAPLAVLKATGTASMDLAPLYLPIVSAVNEEIATQVAKTGSKSFTFTYKDLQDITSSTSDEQAISRVGKDKLEAFKAVGKDLNFKDLKNSVVTQNEDTLIKRMANNPITKVGVKAPTTYVVEGVEPAALDNIVKLLPAGDPTLVEVQRQGGTKMLAGKDELLSLPEAAPDTKYGAGFTMTDKVNKAILEYTKPLSELKVKYSEAIAKFNAAPTPTKLKTLLGAKTKLQDFKDNNIAPWDQPAPHSVVAVKPQEFPVKQPSETPETAPGQPKAVVTSESSPNVNISQEGASKPFEPTTPKVDTSVGKPTKAASDINKELAKKGLEAIPEEQLAKYDPTTKKALIEKTAELMEDINNAKDIVAGRKQIDLSYAEKQVLFNTMGKYALKHNDYKLISDLASSPIATERSLLAQGLGASAYNRDSESVVDIIRDVKKSRIEKSIKKSGGEKQFRTKRDNIISDLKKELAKPNLTKKELEWDSFINEITC